MATNQTYQKADFFIVGAPKCGTSTLHYYLSDHPEVFMAPKELYYFGKDFTFKHGNMNLDYYNSFFKDADPKLLKGDNSVWHLYSKVAASEIYEYNSDAKIIILLRDPVEMIYSLHSQQLYNGNENVSNFEEALDLEKSRSSGKNIPDTIGCPIEALQYHKVASYFEQVKRYLDFFDQSKIKIIYFEDIQNNLKEIIKEVYQFLEIRDIPVIKEEKINPNKVSKNKYILKLLNYRPLWFISLVKTLIPSRKLRHQIINKLWKMNTAETERAVMKSETKKELKDYFRSDITKLEALLNVNLDHWK